MAFVMETESDALMENIQTGDHENSQTESQRVMP